MTREDCEWQTFRAGGKGGQHQNKTETGVRCIHRASGAVGEARDTKSQHTNKIAAFERMVATDRFKNWLRMESARRLAGEQSIEAMVNRAVDDGMRNFNIRVEVKDENNKWVVTTD